MFCGKCGKAIEDTAVTCPFCGAPTSLAKGKAAGENDSPKGIRKEEGSEGAVPSKDIASGKRSKEAVPRQMAGIGISVALFAALIYWSGLITTMPVITILLSGYVLIKEKDQWLRAVALKAVTILIFFGVLLGCIGLLTYFKDVMVDIINMLLTTISISIGGSGVTGQFFTDILDILRYITLFVRDLFLLISGFAALKYGNIPIPVIDRMVNHHIGRMAVK